VCGGSPRESRFPEFSHSQTCTAGGLQRGGGGSTEGKSERTGHQRVPTVFHFNGMDLFRVEGSELRGRVETEGSGVPCSQGTANPSRTPLGPKAPAYGRVLGGGGGFL